MTNPTNPFPANQAQGLPFPGSPEIMSERVQLAGKFASQQLGHDFTGALFLDKFRPRYEVRGLCADGMHRWNFLVWLLKHLLLLCGYVGFLLVALVTSPDAGDPPTYRGKVLSKPGGKAILFAKAARAITRNPFAPDLFLVFSPTRAALVTIKGLEKSYQQAPEIKTRWDATGTDVPSVEGYTGLLSWADNSSVRIIGDS